MSKTKPEIAKAILERRNRMTPVILPGEITAEIGPDGVSEALRERWLVPDVDSGFLCATNDLAVLDEMRKLAQMKPEEYKVDPVPVPESHDSVLLHSKRPHPINEIAAPMTGTPSPGLGTLGQPQSTQPPNPAAGQGTGGIPVGTSVTVARQGVKATGMIEKLLPDGRYKIGFSGQEAKPPGDDIFGKDEMTVVPANPQRSPVTAP
jgi:hypothetical protein